MSLAPRSGALVGLVLAAVRRWAVHGRRDYAGALLAAWVVAWIVVGFAILPYLTVVPAHWLIRRVEELSTAEFVAAVVGLLLGLLMGLLLGFPLSQLSEPCGHLAAARRLALPRARDARPDRRQAQGPADRRRGGRAPPPAGDRPAAAGSSRGDPRIVVDTSAIIDGRIAEIVESGFIYGTLVIPRFVLDELQHIADSSDTLRRNRGRRGLEILNRMQKEPGTPVEIVEDDVPDIAEVDAKLVALALARSRVDPDQRLQPQPRRRAAGRPGDEHQLAGECGQAGRPAGRGAAGPGHPGGQGGRARASASSTTGR